GGYFIFSGSMDDAKSTFLDQFDGRYNNTLNKTGMGENWGAYPPSTLSTLYQGAVAFNNPNATDPTGLAYNVSLIASRLIHKMKLKAILKNSWHSCLT
ncbi:MAG: hypothetical protein ACK53Y_26255, partial [bacterium]